MKKILFLLCAAAMLGTLTSCHKSLDEKPEVSPVILDQSRKLIVTVNTPSDITYGGVTYRNVKTAVFNNANAKGKLTVTPVSNQYLAQDAMAIDFNDKLTLAVNVVLSKKPTNAVSQTDATNGQPVTNDTANQNDTGVIATLTMPIGTTISGNTVDPITIVTIIPSETVLEDTEKGDEVQADVLIISVGPADAVFSQPIPVVVQIDNSEGLDLVCVGPDGTIIPMKDLGGGKWEIDIPAGGDWTVVLKAKVTNVTGGSQTITGTSQIVEGQNSVPYQVIAGGEELTDSDCALIEAYIQSKFGAYTQTTKNASFTSDAPGTATWAVEQPYQDITFTSNGKTFVVRVYGEPNFVITDTSAVTQGHSGGSGK